MPDGNTLAELRSIADVPQSVVAERMGITRPAVSQVEARDYVRAATVTRYFRAIIGAVEERAVTELLSDAMTKLVARWAERGLFTQP